MKNILLMLSVLLILTSGFSACSFTGDNPEFNSATQAAFRAAVDSHFSTATYRRGIVVAVYKDGYRTWSYAAGYSSGDMGSSTGKAMTKFTPAYAYSITKTFISALVLSQVEQELYSLDDTVDELLADYSGYSSFDFTMINRDATVADLLKHTTGMPDYASNIAGLLGMCDPYFYWQPSSIIKKIVNTVFDAAQWESRGFEYSNTNYILLGMIAEHRSGLPLNELLKTLFDAAGIFALLSPQDDVPGDIARPYDNVLGSYTEMSAAIKVLNPDYEFFSGVGRSTWAAGGIIASAANLAKWGYELYDADGTAVLPAVRNRILDSARVDGAYGYGVYYNSFTYDDGAPGGEYGHGGSAPGYKTLMKYEVSERICVVILTNVNNTGGGTGLVDRDVLADDIFNAYRANK